MKIGAVELPNAFALAPMAGLSDVPFRTIAWQLGRPYLVSEMVSSKAELWETGKSRLRRVPVPGATPVAVQIAGTDPRVMAAAAQRHVDDGVEVIDINFGCPAKKVCRKFAGSALLQDLDLVGRIVAAVARAVPVPVTVKTRTGLTPEDDLGVQAGCVAVENGAQMVVMHGRSRACRFNGQAQYTAARLLKGQVDVPVLVNGDINSVTTARHALAVSGADGVMIGRGALGQPWLFAELAGRPLPDRSQKWQIICTHLELMHSFYGEQAGLRIARKHVLTYLQHLGLTDHGKAFLQLEDARQQLDWLLNMSRWDQQSRDAA
ncbi:MAG: tRNA dihydrouridine synthase DusB [bacterium]